MRAEDAQTAYPESYVIKYTSIRKLGFRVQGLGYALLQKRDSALFSTTPSLHMYICVHICRCTTIFYNYLSDNI